MINNIELIYKIEQKFNNRISDAAREKGDTYLKLNAEIYFVR